MAARLAGVLVDGRRTKGVGGALLQLRQSAINQTDGLHVCMYVHVYVCMSM